MSVADTDPAAFRTRVVAESIRLFSEHGYESTTVEQLAAAAGMSRRTFFRQFGSKEDVIFADHESLLAQVGDRLAASDEDPWLNGVLIEAEPGATDAPMRARSITQVLEPWG